MQNNCGAGTEAEVKGVFRKFIAAQNAHDIITVGGILRDSADFLWITVGTPIWGREAALLRFEENYRGTWLIEPRFDEVKITRLSFGVVQLFAPAVFTIAPSGQSAQPKNFLITQVYVKTADGWKISSIVPLPVL